MAKAQQRSAVDRFNYDGLKSVHFSRIRTGLFRVNIELSNGGSATGYLQRCSLGWIGGAAVYTAKRFALGRAHAEACETLEDAKNEIALRVSEMPEEVAA